MDEMKQNLPYDLRNVIKVEKMESSSDSEMQESSYTDTSSELFSGEETQVRQLLYYSIKVFC